MIRNQMVIVTGANSRYYKGLMNLVGSLHYWAPDSHIIIFDLGLKKRETDEIICWKNVELRWQGEGPPDRVSIGDDDFCVPHLRSPKKYAWKPFAIEAALQEHESVLWLDAGSDVRGPLDPVAGIIDTEGHFFVQGQDNDMTALLQKGTYRELGLDRTDFVGKPSFAGNTQGYARGGYAHSEILVPLMRAAANKACIAPFGSSTRNHRFDQAILSLLLHSWKRDVVAHTELLCANRSELSDDPREESKQLIYTARRDSTEYLDCLQ